MRLTSIEREFRQEKAMGKSNFAEQIRNKETYLGIEFGSTRIKSVLTGADSYTDCTRKL